MGYWSTFRKAVLMSQKSDEQEKHGKVLLSHMLTEMLHIIVCQIPLRLSDSITQIPQLIPFRFS